MLLKLGAAVALGVPAAALGGLMFLARSPLATEQFEPKEQPIQFDHRHHAGDERIDCRYCHRTVETSPYAGIPATEVCMGCHAQVWNRSPLLGPVREAFLSGKPLRWNRVHRLPDYVYFDHSIHIAKGVGCVSCHGRVDLMPAVMRTAPLTMRWCLDCHRNPGPNLRPPEAITSMTWQPEQPHETNEVRTRTDCTTCHR